MRNCSLSKDAESRGDFLFLLEMSLPAPTASPPPDSLSPTDAQSTSANPAAVGILDQVRDHGRVTTRDMVR